MVQVDLDYTGAGGKREKEKTEEGKEMPGPMIEDGDLLVMERENTTGGENWTPKRRSKKKEGGYELVVKERRVKVIILIKK